MEIKKLIITSTAAGLLIIGAAAVGAQDTEPTTPPVVESGAGPIGGFGGPGRGGPHGMGMGMGGSQRMPRMFDGNMLESLQSYTGLSAEELATQLREGATIAELIEANDQSVDAFIDEMLIEAEERITERVNTPFGPMNRASETAWGQTLQTYTGLSPQEIAQSLRDGMTVAELIEANGQDVDDFIDEVAALADARIDAAVEAGTLTEVRADELKANVRERITTQVNNPFERGFGFGGPGRGRGWGQ